MLRTIYIIVILLRITISLNCQVLIPAIEKSSSGVRVEIPVAEINFENFDSCSTCLTPYGKRCTIDLEMKDWRINSKNDTTIYSVEIRANGALFMDIILKNLIIPKGSILKITDVNVFSRSYDYKHTLNHELYQAFTTTGESAMLELIMPNYVQTEMNVELVSATYFFKDIFINESDNIILEADCHNDINCAESDNDRALGRSVVYIRQLCTDNPNLCYQCSGSVINNYNFDNIPYILTANHCINGEVMDHLDEAIFVFNYNSVGCGSSLAFQDYQIVGGNLRAHLHGTIGSDFALLELFNDIPLQYNVLWAGWDRASGAILQGQDVIGIHHPDGSFKRISYGEIDNNLAPVIGFIRVEWNDGLVEGGSSGSPLFTEDFKIVGQLGGGPFEGSCNNPGSDYYGHFKESWNSIFGSEFRLKDWLDPDGHNPESLSGSYPIYSCPQNRILTGEFYRTDYSPDNLVSIGAANNLTLTDLTVYENGNYNFKCINTIELSSDVEFKLGCSVELLTGSCVLP